MAAGDPSSALSGDAGKPSWQDWSGAGDERDIVAAARLVLAGAGLALAAPLAGIDAPLRAAGLDVGTDRVRFPAAALARAMTTIPPEFRHLASDPHNSLDIGSNLRPHLGPPMQASLLWSGEHDRRPLSLASALDCIAVSGALGSSGYGASALALHANTGTRGERLDAFARQGGSPLIAPLRSGWSAGELLSCLDDAPGSDGGAEGRPACRMLGLVEIEEALTLDREAITALAAFADAGQGIIVAPVLLLGANTPVNVDAALVRFAAEVMGTAALLQILRPGTPVVAGVIVTSISMRSGMPIASTSDALGLMRRARTVCRELGLPVFALGPVTAGKGLDGQSGAETAAWLAAIGGYHAAIGAIGGLELDAGISLEKMVLDADRAAAMTTTLQPVDRPDASDLARTLIEAGPGASFLSAPETRRAARRATPARLADEWLYESWLAAGSPDARERAQVIVAEILMANDTAAAKTPVATQDAQPANGTVDVSLVSPPPTRRTYADIASAIYNRAMREAFGFKA